MSSNERTAEALTQIKAAWQIIKGSANYMPGSAVREAVILLDEQLPKVEAVAECALEYLSSATPSDILAAHHRLSVALEALGQRAGEEDNGRA